MSKIATVVKALLGPELTKKIRPLGHGLKALTSSWLFKRPARKLKIIGINATKGKTTTTILTGRLLNRLGIKTGYLSTAVINLSGRKNGEILNKHKNTTIDGFIMQKYLREMVENGCTHVVIEMSSQGLEAHRHWGLGGFDVAVFMNMFPEHIEAHGGLDKYIEAKSLLFKSIKKNGVAILSGDSHFSEISEVMWQAIPDFKKPTITRIDITPEEDFTVTSKKNSLFKNIVIQQKTYPTRSTASFEIHNLFYALTVTRIFVDEIEQRDLKTIFAEITETIPGRMEFVELPPKIKYDVIVDYAHEPGSMEQLFLNINEWKEKGFYTKIIHVISSDGVGRDDWKKPKLGDLSYAGADFSIVTTDNYETGDDPNAIVEMISQNFPANQRNKKYVKIIVRKDAMQFAIQKANQWLEKDSKQKILIISTGVGTEQYLTQPDGRLKWDERQMWKKLINVK